MVREVVPDEKHRSEGLKLKGDGRKGDQTLYLLELCSSRLERSYIMYCDVVSLFGIGLVVPWGNLWEREEEEVS